MTTTITLSNGSRFPKIGLGCWKIDQSTTASVVFQALQMGYRHLDCACDYGNEVEVGNGLREAIRQGICRRDEVWVTSKLWNTYHARPHIRPALERTLTDLGLDYLDLYLVHFPIAQEFVPFEKQYPPGWIFDPLAAEPRMKLAKTSLAETWAGMEDLVRNGLVKTIGVCNYNCALLRDLLNYASILPAVLQVETHPYLTQTKLLRFCEESGIAVTAFSPLGALSYLTLKMAKPEESVLAEEVVRAAAERHGRSAAQVVLRWALQRGTAIVPKSSKIDRLRENLQLFNFELSAEEMEQITQLNRNRRFNDPGVFCKEAFGTFCPIYE